MTATNWVGAQGRGLRALRAGPLRGEFRPPGDLGIAARALILGALARGETSLAGSADLTGMGQLAAALRALGAVVETAGETVLVHGLGIGGLLAPDGPLELEGEAVAALTMGLVGLYRFPSVVTGGAALAGRDFSHVLAPLRFMGARTDAAEGRFLPVRIEGPMTPVPLETRLPRPSAVAKGAVLLAALNCPGVSTVIEPGPTHQGLETLLAAFGARIETNDLADGTRAISVAGLPELVGRPISVPADPGLALYPLVAALIVPGSGLLLMDVLVAPSRMGLILTLMEMGADLALLNRRTVGGMEFADIRVRHSSLRGIEVPAERAAGMRRDYHLLALAAAFATGTTTMPGLVAPRGHDLHGDLARALTAAGAAASRHEDRFVIEGAGRLRGGVSLRTGGDPALTLAYLLMGMAARDPVTIDDDSVAAIAYPGFVQRFESLGVRFSRIV